MKKRSRNNSAQNDPPDHQEKHTDDLVLPSSIQTFLKSAQRTGQEIRVVLYRRILKPAPGKPKKSFLEEYENEAPTMKDVAIQYGSGSYEMQILTVPETEEEAPAYFKSVQFNIDDSYGEGAQRIKQPGQTASVSALYAGQISPQEQFNQSIAMITGLVSAIAPLFAAKQQDTNPAQFMASMADIGNTMLSQTFKSQMEAQRQIMDTLRERSDLSTATEEPQEDRTFDRIMQALEMFIPIFLKSTGTVKNLLVQQAQTTPEVKALIADKVRQTALKKKLVDKFGAGQAEQIFEIFKSKNGNGKVSPEQKKKKAPEPSTAPEATK